MSGVIRDILAMASVVAFIVTLSVWSGALTGTI